MSESASYRGQGNDDLSNQPSSYSQLLFDENTTKPNAQQNHAAVDTRKQARLAKNLKKLSKRFPKVLKANSSKRKKSQILKFDEALTTTSLDPSSPKTSSLKCSENLSNRVSLTVFSLNQSLNSNFTSQRLEEDYYRDSVANEAILFDNAELAAKMSDKVREFLATGKGKYRRLNYEAVRSAFGKVRSHDHDLQNLKARERELAVKTLTNEEYLLRNDMMKRWLTAVSASSKITKKLRKVPEVYPDYLRFVVRIKKANCSMLWKSYMEHTKAFIKQTRRGGDTKGLVTVKEKDRYTSEHMDVWTSKLYVLVKPQAIVRDILNPVMSRLGLESRVDVSLTVGCFLYEKRLKVKGTQTPTVPTRLNPLDKIKPVYNSGITDLFLNSSNAEVFVDMPDRFVAASERVA